MLLTELFEGKEDVLYHATYAPLLSAIKSKGLQGGKHVDWSESNNVAVFLVKDPVLAKTFAEDDKEVDKAWLKKVVVLKIDPSKLDASKLKADKAVIKYNGTIPAAAIKFPA